ncbi:Crp/Fnr family transcriptional regulator [Azospirillum thermophilum]|uniref:Crp/Fnr family transcriptional regulator n=2 Tax=Azospirillum thermophilum TaxID=2202148 RepID=A0A2S2CL54_9PROT|nr:Crp/Fnr family transcriptional regulator [Azospirillum thermophilum]
MAGLSDVTAILRRNRLLGELTGTEMAELVSLGRPQSFDADQPVFHKGDPGDCLYAILKGQIGISTSSADGKRMLLNILDAGDVLGEIALIDGRERTAAAEALRPSMLFRIDRSDFIPFLERHPALCTRLMIVLCERLRWVSENIEDAVFHDVPRRLARRLLLLADSYGQQTPAGLRINQSISQEALASMLGVTREMVNKSLKALKKSEIVTYTKGFIVINNPALLRDMAGDTESVS